MDAPAVEERLTKHLHAFFGGHPSERLRWTQGPIERTVPGFTVWRFAPGKRSGLWTYCSVGAWRSREPEGSKLEFVICASEPADRLTELLAMVAYYHHTERLGVGHTFGIGEPWLEGSNCDAMLVSKPYPFGPELEICGLGSEHAHFLWVLPITQAERRFAVSNGLEAIERRFEAYELEYWNVFRPSVV